MPKIKSLEEVYVDQLKDLYSAETQIAKALPKMAKAASDPALKKGFLTHLEQTKEHAVRIAKICEALEEKPTGKKCVATTGLLEEGKEAIEEDALPELKDLMLIGAARRVEHYEIAGYSCAIALAKSLGDNESAKILSMTLSEEEATDGNLVKASVMAITASKGLK